MRVFAKTGLLYSGFTDLESWERPGGKHPFTVARTTNSVSGLLYDPKKDRVPLVRQARPAAILDANPTGVITELIGGRFDQPEHAWELARNPRATAIALFITEAEQEVGARLAPEQVFLLNGGNPLFVSPGFVTERSFLAFAAIDEEQIDECERVFGNKDEDEEIERIWLPADDFLAGPHDCLRAFTLALHLRAYREATR